jgi:hypothetical protein
VVGPRFKWFIPVRWRVRSSALKESDNGLSGLFRFGGVLRSSALKESDKALVLVFLGSTNELVRFLKLWLCGVPTVYCYRWCTELVRQG